MSSDVVVFEGVCKWFGNVKVLDGISLRVREGERVVIVGPNGAGKTTLLRVMLGLLRPDSGRVYVRYRDPRDVGYVPQVPVAFPFHTAFSIVYYALRFAGYDSNESKRRALEWLEKFRINPRAVCMNMSGGERKLVLLAAALAREPKLLILDEPTNMLDLARTRLVWNVLNEFKGTVIIVTHNLDEVKLGNRVLFMKRGKVVFEGSYEEFARYVSGHGYVIEAWTESGYRTILVGNLDEAQRVLRELGNVYEARVRRIVPEDIEQLVGS